MKKTLGAPARSLTHVPAKGNEALPARHALHAVPLLKRRTGTGPPTTAAGLGSRSGSVQCINKSALQRAGANAGAHASGSQLGFPPIGLLKEQGSLRLGAPNIAKSDGIWIGKNNDGSAESSGSPSGLPASRTPPRAHGTREHPGGSHKTSGTRFSRI